MNQADTAWMLISTALVLLMTPALGFFYGGLVRSKNALNTIDDEFHLARIRRRRVGGRRLLARVRARQQLDRRPLAVRSCAASGSRRNGTIPHLLFMCLPGHVLHHHRGADFRRHRRADAVRGLRHLHHAVGHRWSTARSPTGCGAAAGSSKMGALDFAGGTVVHVNAGVAALVAALVVGKRSDYPVVVAAAAQRAVHAARRRRAVVRLVRVQRRQRAGRQPHRGAGLHRHHARAGGHAGGLDAARRRPVAQVDRGRLRHRHRRRPRRGHAGGRLRRADERHRARRAGRRSQLLRAGLARQDVARRLARRRRGPRRRRHGGRGADRCLRAEGAERRRRRRCCSAIPRRSASRSSPSLAAIAYSGAHELRAPQADQPRHAAARHRRATRCAGLDVTQHGEEAYATSGGQSAALPALAQHGTTAPAYASSPVHIS